MAILTGKEILKPFIRKAAGYVKALISSEHVEMNDGSTLQDAMDEINDNLTNKPLVIEKNVKYNGFTLSAYSSKNLGIGTSITVPSIEGYTYIGCLGGWGDGDTGLLFSQNGWIFNASNTQKTWNSVTIKYLYVRKL